MAFSAARTHRNLGAILANIQCWLLGLPSSGLVAVASPQPSLKISETKRCGRQDGPALAVRLLQPSPRPGKVWPSAQQHGQKRMVAVPRGSCAIRIPSSAAIAGALMGEDEGRVECVHNRAKRRRRAFPIGKMKHSVAVNC